MKLLRDGLEIIDLPGTNVLRAQEVMRELPQLSVHDGLAFALADSNPGCVLLTGDGALRELAENAGMVVHGVLWVIDELYGNGVGAVEALIGALHAFANDASVHLPQRTLAAYVRRYEALL